MPFLMPSHQAPVLPLKRWRPAWFSGLGLVLGTVAPDLVFIFQLDENGSAASHTFTGQLTLTVPMVLGLYVLATALVLPWLLPHLPGGQPLFLHALGRSRPLRDGRDALRVAVSGLVGGVTHVFLDGFTHGNHAGWAVALLPALRFPVPLAPGPVPLHDVLQVVLSVLLGAPALREWQRQAGALAPAGPGAAAVWEVREAPLGARRAVRAFLLASALLGAWAAPTCKGARGEPHAPKLAAYGAVTAACLAAAAGAAASRLRRAAEGVRLVPGPLSP